MKKMFIKNCAAFFLFLGLLVNCSFVESAMPAEGDLLTSQPVEEKESKRKPQSETEKFVRRYILDVLDEDDSEDNRNQRVRPAIGYLGDLEDDSNQPITLLPEYVEQKWSKTCCNGACEVTGPKSEGCETIFYDQRNLLGWGMIPCAPCIFCECALECTALGLEECGKLAHKAALCAASVVRVPNRAFNACLLHAVEGYNLFCRSSSTN